MSIHNFELMPLNNGKSSIPLSGKRMLVGSSRACDIYIEHPGVSGIHAVIEINDDSFKIYDMNSLSGTFVAGSKIVSSEFQLGDIIKFGIYEYKFKNLVSENQVPPVLDILQPKLPPVAPVRKSDTPDSTTYSLPKVEAAAQDLPEAPNSIKKTKKIYQDIPLVSYPLEQDPKAEFSEYIFEDTETIYPIFDYSVNKMAIEVIIMFKDKVLSIDYLPAKLGIYSLVGIGNGNKEIEYPYLGVKESVAFVEQKENEVILNSIHGYDAFCISDKSDDSKVVGVNSVILQDDIYHFVRGDIQIFVRGTQTPPVVAHAPLFGRDKELRKYLLLMFLAVGIFLGGISLFEVDKELEEEKAPERIATILYKKKLVISKKKAIDKTKKAPKKIAQKSPAKKKVLDKKKPTKKVVTKKSNRPKKVKTVGTKSAKKHQKVKKVSANKARKDNLKTNKVVRMKKSTSGSRRSKSSANRKKYRNSKSKGAVETYKSSTFKSTLSSLMAKGGGTKSVSASVNNSSSVGNQSLSYAADGATLKSAKVSNNIGSLAGASTGRLDSTKGAQGIVGKRSIHTAGLPSLVVLRGGMNPDVIRRILMDHLPQFRYCYQRVLDKAANGFNGVVKLNFIIGASGHVTRAGVNSDSGRVPLKVRSCSINVLKGIKFPSPPGGGIVEVNQPLNFNLLRK